MAIDHPQNAERRTKVTVHGQTYVLTGQKDGETGRPLVLPEDGSAGPAPFSYDDLFQEKPSSK